NILFFEQKNLIIFPYVDLKHLHALEIFTAGFNIVDLESTALHNLKEILEFEKNNTYSQNPTLFFITNVNKDKIKDIMNLEKIRCIINSNENSNFRELANGSSFIFFNKKNNQFLNYDCANNELEFENELISDSKNEVMLQDKIQKLKLVGTTIFTELNQNENLDNIYEILGDYNKKYWNKILEYTSKYFDINIPKIEVHSISPRRHIRSPMKDFSKEYELCVSFNKQIGKEFVQFLHKYRSERVNPAHLELEELYDPQKLYNYLRNHHWKDGIPESFISSWVQMDISGYRLTEEDLTDFKSILRKLGIQSNSFFEETPPKEDVSHNIAPFPGNAWDEFKQYVLNYLDKIEYIINNFLDTRPDKSINNESVELRSFLLGEFLELNELFGKQSSV
ncbi:MAG: hypothetical protein ACFFDH_23295, partial [Promethearchaeota archaeon]